MSKFLRLQGANITNWELFEMLRGPPILRLVIILVIVKPNVTEPVGEQENKQKHVI